MGKKKKSSLGAKIDHLLHPSADGSELPEDDTGEEMEEGTEEAPTPVEEATKVGNQPLAGASIPGKFRKFAK